MKVENSRERIRAVFLAALMILSVSVGTVAFAGTATADAANIAVDGKSSVLIQPGTSVTVTADDGGTDDGSTVYAILDTTNIGKYDSGGDKLVSASSSDGVEVTIGSFDTSGLSDGSYDVYVVEADSEPTDGSTLTGDASLNGAVEIDGTPPSVTTDLSDGQVLSSTVDLSTKFAVSNNDGNSITYEYSTNGGSSWTTIGSPSSFDTSEAGDGDVVLKASSTDDADNTGSAEQSVVVDNVAPSVSTSLSSGAELSGSVDLSSKFSVQNDDETGLAYEYSTNDGSSWQSVSGSSLGTNGFDDGALDLRATATDKAGNSDSASKTVQVNNQKLEVTTSLSSGAELSGTVELSTKFSIQNDDGTGLTYEYSTDGGDAWQAVGGSSFDTTTVADGEIVLKASSTDAAGNSDSASQTVAINNQQLDVSTSLQSGDVLSGTPDLTEHFTVSNNDGNQVTYEYSTNGGDSWQAVGGSSFDTTTVADGEIVLKASSTDAAGNSDSVQQAVQINNQKLSVTTSLSSGAELSGPVDLSTKFTVSNNDGEAVTYEYSTNGGDSWQSVEGSSFDRTTVADGEVVLKASSTDAAGNADSAQQAVQINNQKLSVTTSLSSGAELSGSVDLSTKFTVSNNDGNQITYEYSTDGGSSWQAVGGSSFDTTTVSDGELLVKASSTDAAGNDDSAQQTVVVDNQNPKVATSLQSGAELSGTVDLTEHFTVQNDDGNAVTYEYSTDGSTWETVGSPGSFDTTGFDDGALDLKASVTDSAGNSDSASQTVQVNNQKISVSTSLSSGAELSSTVDLSTKFSVQNDDGTGLTYEYSTNGGDSWQSVGSSSFDTNNVDDGDLLVKASSTDAAGNDDSAQQTVAVNNQQLVVTTSLESSDVLSKTIDLTKHFTVSNNDGETVSYEYSTDGGSSWQAVGGSSFDTTTVADGEVVLKASSTDAAGNADSAQQTVTVDNQDPTVTTSLTAGQELTGTVTLPNYFTIKNNDDNEITYKYSTNGGDSWTAIDSPSSFDTSTFDEGALLVGAKTTDDGGDLGTVEKNIQINNEQLGVSTSLTTGQELAGAVDLTKSFTVSNNDGKTVTYEYSTDGGSSWTTVRSSESFDTTALDEESLLVKASSTDAAGNADSAQQSVVVDNRDPTLSNAWISSAGNTGTEVTLMFSEPVDISGVSASEVEIGSTTADSIVSGVGGSSTSLTVKLDSQLQTGTKPKASISGDYAETTGDTKLSSETVVHTVRLQLDEGTNFVSIPAASGLVNLDDIDTSNVKHVVMYEKTQAGDSWRFHTFDGNSKNDDFQKLKGGQGYVFVMESADTIDVNVDNVPAGTAPTEEDLREGWNLVGHWQEGSQDATKALSSLNSGTLGDSVHRVYGQAAGASDFTYTSVQFASSSDDELSPGEAYWIFVKDDEVYTEAGYAN